MGLYLLIPLSVVLVFIIGVIFWWSVRSGQYDDMEGPAYRLLMDDKDAVRSDPPDTSRGAEEGGVDGPADQPGSDVQCSAANAGEPNGQPGSQPTRGTSTQCDDRRAK